MWVKNASNDRFDRSDRLRTTFAIGIKVFSNLAFWMFFNITRFEPFWLTTFSSLGRLKAAVWTPLLPSPLEKTSLTTRIGDEDPSFGFRYFWSIGRLSSSSC